jgi:hypothetical protein
VSPRAAAKVKLLVIDAVTPINEFETARRVDWLSFPISQEESLGVV